MRATNQNGQRIFLAILATSAMLTAVVLWAMSGCALHVHVWGTYDADRYDVPTTQRAGAKTPEITLEIPNE